MNLSAILNADMATVRGWLLSGYRWWTGELESMLPVRWKPAARSVGLVAMPNGKGRLDYFRNGVPVQLPANANPRVRLLVPDGQCLRRTQIVPNVASDDIRRLIALESERLTPLPADEMLLDYEYEPGIADNGGRIISVAMLPRAVAIALLAVAKSAGVAPTHLSVATGPGAANARFDFASQLRAEGLLPAMPPSRVMWWGLVATAFVLNLGMIVARDRSAVEAMAEMVQRQAPAVATARTISNRIRQFETNSALLVHRRTANDALGTLGLVSAALPSGAWVQRYAWNGATLRLTGYRLRDADVLSVLRKQPAFARVRPTSSDVVAEIPAGQPFDVSITIRGASR